jgi:hypothetical protein
VDVNDYIGTNLTCLKYDVKYKINWIIGNNYEPELISLEDINVIFNYTIPEIKTCSLNKIRKTVNITIESNYFSADNIYENLMDEYVIRVCDLIFTSENTTNVYFVHNSKQRGKRSSHKELPRPTPPPIPNKWSENAVLPSIVSSPHLCIDQSLNIKDLYVCDLNGQLSSEFLVQLNHELDNLYVNLTICSCDAKACRPGLLVNVYIVQEFVDEDIMRSSVEDMRRILYTTCLEPIIIIVDYTNNKIYKHYGNETQRLLGLDTINRIEAETENLYLTENLLKTVGMYYDFLSTATITHNEFVTNYISLNVTVSILTSTTVNNFISEYFTWDVIVIMVECLAIVGLVIAIIITIICNRIRKSRRNDIIPLSQLAV